MGNSCSIIPNKGKTTFNRLKANFGYNKAAIIFNNIGNSRFLNANRDTLVLDDEGIPTYDSIINTPAIQKFLGKETILSTLNKQQEHLEDNLENVAFLISKMSEFNSNNKSFISYIDYDQDNNIFLKIQYKNKEAEQITKTQENIQKLNTIVSQFLNKAGITMSELSKIEVAAGRVGITNFIHAKDIANNFAGLIAISNNFEGYKAFSEEFAHLIIGIYRNKPIIQRGINTLLNQKLVQEVLGDNYQEVYDYYQGDKEKIAEEALGQLFRDRLLNTQEQKVDLPIFKRIINFILNLFKGINYGAYIDSIDTINIKLDDLAQQIVNDKIKITKRDIVQSARDAHFNALSEKVKLQINVLKESINTLAKNALLQEDLEADIEDIGIKQRNKEFVNKVRSLINSRLKKEETMDAIVVLLENATSNINLLYDQLRNIDNLATKDKFKVLKNTLYNIQAYDSIISQLRSVLTEDFLTDEEINKQKYISSSKLQSEIKDFESKNGTEEIDTEGKTLDEIAKMIVEKSEDFELSKDGEYYVNKKTGYKYYRVTQAIKADEFGEGQNGMDKNDPWYMPSTNIGTGIDEFIRDFLSGRIIKNKDKNWIVKGTNKLISEVYPNADYTSLSKLIDSLKEFKTELNKKGIKLITRDVVANGTIEVIDAEKVAHRVRVAGTLDLLGYDKDGNWYIYDMKTFRSKITTNKKQKYERQVTLYKTLLEEQFGIKVKDLNIIPIHVQYPNPEENNYTVSKTKPKEYYGKESNQLIVNGQQFKGSNPVMEEIMPVSVRKLHASYKKLTGDYTGGIGEAKNKILELISNVERLRSDLNTEFNTKALHEFLEFLKPFIGENIKLKDDNGIYREFSIAKLIEEASYDTNIITTYFSSMADNPNALLQVYDKIVKRQKDIHRIKTIELSQQILALGKKYEKLGITDYDWMFEEDKDSYIIHYISQEGNVIDYNKSKYKKAYNEFVKTLDQKYGDAPDIGSEDYNNKNSELKQWISENTEKITINGKESYIPKMSIYKSDYDTLSNTKKEFFNQWMEIKQELDDIIGQNRTNIFNTIKIRKSNIERIKDGNLIDNFINSVKSNFMKSYDDDINYGGVTTLRGFNGEELMKLPLYYLHNNGDNSDLSTDVIGTLIAYTDMVYNYEAMNAVVDQLEIGKEVIIRNKKIKDSRGGNPLQEKFKLSGKTYTNNVYIDIAKTNFLKALNQFMESKVYNRYFVNSGDTPILKTDNNKLASFMLKLGSMAQLGFNGFAQTANLLTGINVQNIEAVASEFFSASELLQADGIFTKEMMSYISDIGQRIPNSKLALFDQLFDVKQNFSSKIKSTNFLNKTILTRIFGPRLQFLGQDAGDFWLYNRTAISMALKEKVLYNGNKISLWEAFEVVQVDSSDPSLGSKLKIKEGVTTVKGNKIDDNYLSDFSGKIRYVNQHLFGIYNEEDSINARRLILGRFLMQYRDWIPTAFRYRFGSKTTNLEKGDMVEGYYRTLGKFMIDVGKELKQGQFNLSQIYDQLEDYEKANIKRGLYELFQFLVIWGICVLLHGGGDDKNKKSWFRRFINYMATREKTELGVLTPVGVFTEGTTILKSPFANASIIDDTINLGILLYPPNYYDEIQSGDYKGHSSAYRAFMRSPLTLWYRTIKRQIKPERSEQFYNQ